MTLLLALLVGCQTGLAPSPSGAPTPHATVNETTLIAAGDIADCQSEGEEATAALLAEMGGTVLALGDLAYPDGTAQAFQACYQPTWGRHKDRTLPVVGNHEYDDSEAEGYLGYWGEIAAPNGELWYSTDVGSWHVIVINSVCVTSEDCDIGSAQMPWLRQDLAADDARCTVVAMHHPRWSSGTHGDHPNLDEMWRALYDADVDVILSAHDHIYERFAPMTPDGEIDEERGIRSFQVGTGGAPLRGFEREAPNFEVRNRGTWGVLRLDLRPDSYDWEFVPVEGAEFTDRGSGVCH